MESLGVFRRLQLELFGMDIVLTLVAIIVLVVLSAFFSGSETALTAARRSRIHQLEVEGDRRASLAARLIARRERLIGAVLLGNNLVNILASALAAAALNKAKATSKFKQRTHELFEAVWLGSSLRSCPSLTKCFRPGRLVCACQTARGC